MRTITLKDIHKSYGPTVALDGVSFSIAPGKRLAIVGENGAGKSTLLKILCGKLEADSGSIVGGDDDCAYIAQDFSGRPEESPYDFLKSKLQVPDKAIALLESSSFDLGHNQQRLRTAHTSELSGGELKKLEIVAGIASEPAFIALDEPENHLDYQTIEWLIQELSHFRGGLIFISHDQYLVDALADTILELNHGKLTVYSMTYQEYLDEKVRQLQGEGRDYEIESREIKRLHASVELWKNRLKITDKGAATYRQTKRKYEDLKEKHGEAPKTETEKPKVQLAGVERKNGKLIVKIDALGFGYSPELPPVFANASGELRFGEKVVLFGRNGSGKSTLLNLIIGHLLPQSGSVRIGNDVRYQIMTQDHLEGIDSSQTPIQVMMDTLEWDEVRARSMLTRYGIPRAVMERPLSQLSGGQQARFKLALTFAQNPEFLILDEPTNHVDPPTWEAIVSAIQGFEGTVLAITHDRALIDAIADKLWVLEGKRIRVHLGTLSDYLNPQKPVIEAPDDYREYMIDT